jgi:hypothetical protein
MKRVQQQIRLRQYDFAFVRRVAIALRNVKGWARVVKGVLASDEGEGVVPFRRRTRAVIIRKSR